MARVLNLAAAQMGPIARAETRAQCVARLIAMMREAISRRPSRIARMITIWTTVSACSATLTLELSVRVITVSIAPGLAMDGMASG